IVNKIDPVVTNHLPTNGNTGIVNKIDPVVTNHVPANGNTGIVNKIDPVVTNHVPTNGNTGIVNKIDPVVTNRLPTNTGIVKPIQGNGQMLNNGVVNNKVITGVPANNNAPQFHPLTNNVRPMTLTTGNNMQAQSHGPVMQAPARNFGGGGGGNNM